MTTATSRPSATVSGGSPARAAWLAVGIAATAFALLEVVSHSFGLAPVIAFALLPDVTFLAGAGQPHEPGQIPVRAVALYNLAHNPLFPIALIAAAAASFVSPFWLVAGLVWLAHIALDRALGFGRRTDDGWQRR